MSEKIQEQISAFLDGELPANEAELLVHRLSRDEAMRGKAVSYRLIGAAMRNELLAPHPDQLRRNVLRALDADSAPTVSPAVPRWDYRQLMRPAVGVALAASVAVIAILGLQTITQPGGSPGARPLVTEATQTPAPSYVVPQETLDGSAVQLPIRLTNYLVNHGEYASGLRRAAIHSDIVGSQSNVAADDDAADAQSP